MKIGSLDGAVAGGTVDMGYGAPTIKLLNPELYKEMERRGRAVRDPMF